MSGRVLRRVLGRVLGRPPIRPATAGVALALLVLLLLVVSAPALVARHHAETTLPAMRQAVTDTTLERWVDVDAGTSDTEERNLVEQHVVDRLAEAGIETVVLGMRPSLRYDPDRVQRLAELDVRVVLAVPTYAPTEANRVRDEVRWASARTGASVLMPQPTESHPSLPPNADWMREYELALTDIAGGTAIPGIDRIARPGHVVRAHEIPVGLDDPAETVTSRALRAVKERGVRMVVYRYAERQQVNPLESTADIAERVTDSLPPGVHAVPAVGSEGDAGVGAGADADAGADAGVGAGGHRAEGALVGGASALPPTSPVVSVPAWLGLPVGLLGATVAALLVALPFPARASRESGEMIMVPWSFRGSHGKQTVETPDSPWEPAVRLTAALLVTVATGLVVAASGASWAQMVGIQSFTGVKLLLLGPPLLVGLLGAWRHRTELVAAATPRRVTIVAVLAAIVLGLYLFRSGNVGIAFTPELWLRDRLDDLLYIRPRFKEMLLGIPALTLAALTWSGRLARGPAAGNLAVDAPADNAVGGAAADGPSGGSARGPAGHWRRDAARWLLAALGAIGTASVVDTFAHFHTPVWAGLLRTGYAIVIGVPLGLAAWRLWKRFGWRRGGGRP